MERKLILEIAACIVLATIIGALLVALLPIWLPVLLVDTSIMGHFQEKATKRGIRMMMSAAKGRLYEHR